jgi:hypothetical protein
MPSRKLCGCYNKLKPQFPIHQNRNRKFGQKKEEVVEEEVVAVVEEEELVALHLLFLIAPDLLCALPTHQ